MRIPAAPSGALVVDDVDVDAAGSSDTKGKPQTTTPIHFTRGSHVQITSVSTKGSVQSAIDVSISSSELSLSAHGLSFTGTAALEESGSLRHSETFEVRISSGTSVNHDHSRKRQRAEDAGEDRSYVRQRVLPPVDDGDRAPAPSLPEPGEGELWNASFAHDAAWQAVCADIGVSMSAWQGGTRASDASEDEGMVRAVQEWNLSTIVLHSRTCLGPIPWLPVRISSLPSLSPTAVNPAGGGMGEEDTLMAVAEDPTGRMVTTIHGDAVAKYGISAGCVLLLRDATTYSIQPSPASVPQSKRLLVGEQTVYRVYRPE